MHVANPPTKPVAKPRDPRLDFFRGAGMFIILYAHIPQNTWADWIPARFGFSDAADLFVFCSGMASAIAFGRVFTDYSWFVGAARIVHRMWQVYWAHVGSFLVTLGVLVSAESYFGVSRYLGPDSSLAWLVNDPKSALFDFLTLAWAPPYFDILPMYIVILGMIPIVMALARVHVGLAFAFMLSLWAGANFLSWNLTGDRIGGWGWFFNPFAWQLVFFTGFAFMRGWLPTPPRDRRLLWASVIFCVVCAPFSCQFGFACYAGWGYAPTLGEIHDWLEPVRNKTYQGPLRFAHFLATVYIAWYVVGERGANLKGPFVEMLRKVGQQTLAVFLVGIVASQTLGVLLDQAGRDFFTTAAANIVGSLALLATAYTVAWFKAPPWKKKAPVKAPQLATQASRDVVETSLPARA